MRAWLCALALLCCATAARAEPLDVAQLEDSIDLTPFVRFLRDDSGSATLEQVRAAYAAGRFVPVDKRVPHFGFTSSVHWVAFRVLDSSRDPRPWILRQSYSQIDHLTLYRVLPDGSVQSVESGDLLPFAQRPRASLELTFEEHGQRAPTQYFLRAQTSGSLRLPLSAWRPDKLLAKERRDELIALAFLGGIAALALYNLGVYLLIKQLEHLIFVAVVVAELVALSSFGGLLAPLFPSQPELVNRALPLSLVSVLLLVAAFSVAVLRRYPELERETTWVQRSVAPLVAVSMFCAAAPLGLSLRTALLACLSVGIAGGALLVRLDRKQVPGVKLHVRGWMCVVAALALQALLSTLMLPSSFLTDWGSHLGCLLQGIVISLALAQQVTLIKERLAINVSELELALARAEQATRVKDEFVATMSHELRTPLNAVINIPLALLEKFSAVPGAQCDACGDQFALDDGELLYARQPCPSCDAPRLRSCAVTQFVGDPAQAKHYLALAERCGKHLLQMVNGVLDYSKIAAGKFELQLAPVDPIRLMREASESMQEAAAQKGVTVRLDLPFEPTQLATLDELRIRQVLLNLLSNAIKFSNPGGVITLSAHEHEHELEIAVDDQGIGIAHEHLDRIFAGFEQVHRGDNRKYGGSGLGLSISRSLVRMHGGELWVESELGKGAIFKVRLPRDPSLTRVANDNMARAV
ncbi:MAG: ATP-binding protein [Polyangiales bacterium]